jgi:hydrogenase maturation protease
MSVSSSILFVGVGSPHGDDQVGWQIADALAKRVAASNHLSIRKAAVPMDILDWLDVCDELHLCDAAMNDHPIGTLRRFQLEFGRTPETDWSAGVAALSSSSGSHDFGLAATLDLAAKLTRLPPLVVVHAVSAHHFQPGDAISNDLFRTVPSIASEIFDELTNARDVAG